MKYRSFELLYNNYAVGCNYVLWHGCKVLVVLFQLDSSKVSVENLFNIRKRNQF